MKCRCQGVGCRGQLNSPLYGATEASEWIRFSGPTCSPSRTEYRASSSASSMNEAAHRHTGVGTQEEARMGGTHRGRLGRHQALWVLSTLPPAHGLVPHVLPVHPLT